jgi:hypothetical protein
MLKKIKKKILKKFNSSFYNQIWKKNRFFKLDTLAFGSPLNQTIKYPYFHLVIPYIYYNLLLLILYTYYRLIYLSLMLNR